MTRITAQLLAIIPILLLHGLFGIVALFGYLAVTASVNVANTAKTRDLSQKHAQLVAAVSPAVSLQANGGTIGGNVTVQGDHHIQGSLYGSGGVLPVGDQAQFNASGNGPTGSNTFLGMNNSQASFLDNLSQMSGEGTQGLGSDGFGGGVWTASQASSLQTLQGIMNNGIGGLNALIGRLQSNGYMA
jgi:hypothetical protein